VPIRSPIALSAVLLAAACLLCTAPDHLAWYDDAPTEPGPGEVVVVAEHSAAKHGTEMAFYRGYAFERGPWNERLQLHESPGGELAEGYPFHVGNMYAGVVARCGEGVDDPRPGDRVVGYGGFAETHLARPAELLPLPTGMPWASALCYDPAQFALAAVRDGSVRIGDAVVVSSLGAIGLMAVQAARLAGAVDVIALDPIARRREVAEGLTGCTTLDPASGDPGRRIKELTDDRGADVVIDFAGRVESIQTALRGVAYGGTVVLGAFPPPLAAGLDLGAEAHLNVPRIVCSRACSQPNPDHPRWSWDRINRTVWRYLVEGRLTGSGIVDPVVPFDELDSAYRAMADHPERTVKLGTTHPRAETLLAELATTAEEPLP